VNRKVEQGGFTLIELVVVITILGILAAFAVPRFASLEGQARLAATQALAGSVRSGASLAHALWLAQGNPASTSVTMEGTAITMENGYPNDATIAATIVDTSGFAVTTPAGTAVFTKTSPTGTPIANCFVTYTPAPLNGAPNVVTTTGGC
jgi:MSHA pilin protein MshA